MGWETVYALTRVLFWCLFPELWSNDRNKYQNNIWVKWINTIFHCLVNDRWKFIWMIVWLCYAKNNWHIYIYWLQQRMPWFWDMYLPVRVYCSDYTTKIQLYFTQYLLDFIIKFVKRNALLFKSHLVVLTWIIERDVTPSLQKIASCFQCTLSCFIRLLKTW